MEPVNVCPRCGAPVEARPGKAVAINRRRDLPEVNEHGDRMAFVPTVTAMIVECENFAADCSYTAAGFVDMGVFTENRELIPMAFLYRRIMQYRDDHGSDGPMKL